MGREGAASDTQSRFRSRWGLNFALLLLGAFAAVLVHGHITPIDSYRVDADGRLVVTVLSGSPGNWNRVATVEETNAEVTVTVRTATLPVAMASIGVPTELVVRLEGPLGSRVVIDARWGEPVPPPP